MKVAAAIKTLNAAAAKFGGHVEDDSGTDVCLQICAPEGKVWAESGSQHIVVCTKYGPQEWLDKAVDCGLDEISLGIQDAIPE
jgi:hypothetical protein